MSLQSWCNEFYLFPADEMAEQHKAEVIEVDELVKHSLRKWRGLTPGNLKLHGLIRAPRGPSAIGTPEPDPDDGWCGLRPPTLGIDAGSCALCAAFDPDERYDEESDDWLTDCGECPLYLVRGKVSCDTRRAREKSAPYVMWLETGDPQPMIEWLEKALKECE